MATDAINEVRELLNGITPQPWEAHGNGVHRGIHAVATTHADIRMQRFADAAFIARAPELLQTLADQVEQLRRGEFICQRCHLRKDAEFERGDF